MKLPAELKGRVWHTTSLVRFQQILRDQAILPEPPTVDNSERWKTGSGPELYPYVRVIGGVSLFDFRGFDEQGYSEKYPLSSWRTFVPQVQKWDAVVWIEIDTTEVADNLILGQDLVDKWKRQEAYKHTIMPIIEVAHIGPLPTSAFQTVLVFSKDNPAFVELEYCQ